MLDLFTGRKVMILDSKNFLPFPFESSITFDQDRNGRFSCVAACNVGFSLCELTGNGLSLNA